MTRTPMSSAGGSPAQGGFTLFELLVVMLIVVLSAVAIAAALPRTGAGPAVDLAAVRVADGFKKARMRAVSRGTTVALVIDADQHSYRIGPAGPVIHLPDTVSITPLHSAVIRFFPDGGADPAAVRLIAGGQTRRVEVSPLTGRVALR